MTLILRFATLVLTLAAALPALAAEPVFGPAIRFGLIPLEGMSLATEFPGLQSADGGIKVILGELPADAFKAVDDAQKAAPPAEKAKIEQLTTASGPGLVTAESGTNTEGNVRLYSLIVSGGSFSGYAAVQVKEAAQAAYPDDKVKALLATASFRKTVPVPEQLALLPFNMTELSNFKTVRTVMIGSAILLSDDTEDGVPDGSAPYILVSVVQAKPDSPETRDRFAQQAVAAIQGLNNGRIVSSEAVRIEGAPGYETRVEATTAKGDTPIQLVQWLRFGGNATLRIIAASKKDDWTTAFPRFRAVRDGIQVK